MNGAIKPLVPTRHRETTLNDLIDRLLEKGLFLNTDLIIGVAGIPLLGVNLRLALAGMSTMLRYGFMRDWDQATRDWESRQRRKTEKQSDLSMEQGESLVWSGFAAHWYERGIYASWRPGIMYLTDRRLVLLRREPREVLLEVPYREVVKLESRRNTHFTGAEREELQLLLSSGDLERVHATEINRVIEYLSQGLGLNIDSIRVEQPVKLPARWFKVWYRADRRRDSVWRPGMFCVEEGRLLWRTGPKEHPEFSLCTPDLLDCELQYADIDTGLTKRPVLQLRCLTRHDSETACFSGSEEVLSFWLDILQAIQGDELELCPDCGAPGPVLRLLNKGCGYCGWLSAKKRRGL
jgi:hypothetical protein